MKKKMISLLMIVMMIFSNFQYVGAAVSKIDIAVTQPTNNPGGESKGTITATFTNIATTDTITLYSSNNTTPSSFSQVSNSSVTTISSSNHQFTDLAPGYYYVKSDNGIQSNTSSVQPVAPKATFNESTNTITVTGGDTATTSYTLYKEGSTETKTTSGGTTATFSDIDTGKYTVRQTVNGVESNNSQQIIVIPKDVTFQSKSPDTKEQEGTITVKGQTGHTLYLYTTINSNTNFIGNPLPLPSSNTATFTGLKAGTYYVKQAKDGLFSTNFIEVKIEDLEPPFITLKPPAVSVSIYPNTKYDYRDSNFSDEITDNLDITKIGLHTVTSLTRKITDIDSTSLLDITTIDSSNVINKPGRYAIAYTVKDSAGNTSLTATRTITVTPNKVTLSNKNTFENNNASNNSYGSITVYDVWSDAEVFLYQGTQRITNAILSKNNDGSVTFKNVSVGTGYYVIQRLNGQESERSALIDIKDTTKPVLTLNGGTVNLVVGDRYIDPGALATDNITPRSELTIDTNVSNIDITKPGTYTVYYDVTDKAGNQAEQISRTVNVKPKKVTAVGSTASLGEVSVTNATLMSGTGMETTLKLYKLDKNPNNPPIFQTKYILEDENSHVFTNQQPGRYYVTQTINGQESAPSNIVEIIDTDRPYITLKGSDKISLVLNEDKDSHYIAGKFIDPGATAIDYLDGNLTKSITAQLTTPDGSSIALTTKDSSELSFNTNFDIDKPGIYTVTYSLEAKRGTKAEDRKRVITVAPPKVVNLTSVAGTSTITPTGIYNHATTIVKLYNTHGQLVDLKTAKNLTTVTFNDVFADLGYYVTQTVNGIESAPSAPVNVSLYKDADFIGFTSFGFDNLHAPGIIDQENKTITVTVPFGTDVTSLTPTFKTTATSDTVTVNSASQSSGTTSQNFTNSVTYTVSNLTASKTYTVTVKVATRATSDLWSKTLKKDIPTDQTISLSSAEKAAAAQEGISFITDTAAIHVSPINIVKSNNAILTVKPNSSFIKSGDPSWCTDLSNILEIGWGGQTTPFLQPIEVELDNPDDKAFVRLVRDNGKLYAIVQPSQTKDSKIIGLATEPGTYALLNSVKIPSITPKTANGTTSYTSNSTSAKIYYTTNSKLVTFDRSARSTLTAEFSEYLFAQTPSNLADWTLYTNTAIPASGEDLYAIVVDNQIISKATSIEGATAEQWKGTIPTVATDKIWSISFNSAVDPKALYSNVMYVTDDTTTETVPTYLQLSKDGKTISIIPAKNYDRNKQYTLWVNKQIKGSSTNTFLNEPTKLTFTTE